MSKTAVKDEHIITGDAPWKMNDYMLEFNADYALDGIGPVKQTSYTGRPGWTLLPQRVHVRLMDRGDGTIEFARVEVLGKRILKNGDLGKAMVSWNVPGSQWSVHREWPTWLKKLVQDATTEFRTYIDAKANHVPYKPGE